VLLRSGLKHHIMASTVLRRVLLGLILYTCVVPSILFNCKVCVGGHDIGNRARVKVVHYIGNRALVKVVHYIGNRESQSSALYGE
jgi:hypothetical protein